METRRFSRLEITLVIEIEVVAYGGVNDDVVDASKTANLGRDVRRCRRGRGKDTGAPNS